MWKAGTTSVAAALAPSLLTGCPEDTAPAPTFEFPPNSFGIEWDQATPFGIDRSDLGEHFWQAGRVNDILEHDNALIVATPAGGVWMVLDNGDLGLPLSKEWESPDVACLSRGPDGHQHFFAACVYYPDPTRGVLYMTDVTTTLPLLAPWTQIDLPNIGIVHEMLVDQATRRIVLATDNGLWWGIVPQHGLTDFQWKRAVGLPVSDAPFFGAAFGPGGSVVVSAFPATAEQVNAGHLGFFRGAFSLDDLTMSASTTSIDITNMRATSIAAFEPDPTIMYAALSHWDGTLLAIAASSDGGASWAAVEATLFGVPEADTVMANAGAQGNGYNNAIGVSRENAGTFAVGWQNNLYLTIAAGEAFTVVPAGHTDFTAIRFADGPDGEDIYVSSDGGVHRTHATATLADGRMSRRLANLEFLGRSARGFWGVFSASPAVAGLVAGGLQDNACAWTKRSGGTFGPFHPVGLGDGGAMAFLANGDLLRSDIYTSLHHADWNGTAFMGDAEIPTGVAAPEPGVPTDPIVEPLRNPTYRNPAGQLLHAVVGGFGSRVFGLFGADDGTGLHLDYVTSVPVASGHYISAITALDDGTVLVGVRGSGAIHRFNLATPSNVTLLSGPPTGLDSVDAFVLRFVVVSQSPPDVIAARNVGNTSTLFRYTGGADCSLVTGARLPGKFIFALEIGEDSVGPLLFVAVDDGVFAAATDGLLWENVSRGLPRTAHCADLSYVHDADGTRRLYLATWGRSVWETELP